VTSVKQDLYLPAFERRYIKINRKCTAIAHVFSQALFLGQHQTFLTNLETSTQLYERLAQGKQISSREERQMFAFSRILDSFEGELDASQHSLPSTLCNRISTQPLEALFHYMGELEIDFALHLVLDNHIVAIYRVGSTYAYFDNNVALAANLSGPTKSQIFEETAHALNSSFVKLKRNIYIRWNSTYDMIEKALKMKNVIDIMCIKDEDLKSYTISSDEWKNLEKVFKFLELFYEALNILSGHSYSSVCFVIPLLKHLLTYLNIDFEDEFVKTCSV
jgi:hypothetical protein